jgi:hypothetical protein
MHVEIVHIAAHVHAPRRRPGVADKALIVERGAIVEVAREGCREGSSEVGIFATVCSI